MDATAPSVVWSVVGKGEEVLLRSAELVAVNRSWRTYRNPKTGEQWKENGGGRWHHCPTFALLTYIEENSPFGQTAWVRELLGENREAMSRRAVKAAALLARLWASDPVTGNVYADWLEENGEPRAAALLRKRFPLDAGVTP